MAYSYIQYTGNGTQRDFTFSFSYLDKSAMQASINGVLAAYSDPALYQGSFAVAPTTATGGGALGSGMLYYNTATALLKVYSSGTWLTNASQYLYSFTSANTINIAPAPVSTSIVQLRRRTGISSPVVTFIDGSVLQGSDLSILANFSLYTAQENSDAGNLAIDSATAATASAGASNTSAAAALVSQLAAASSAAAALVSQNAASTSATTSSTQATNSANSATASASSATTSTAQAVISTAQAVIATTQAGLATTNGAAQVTLATTQATNSATSATASLASQVAAAASAVAAAASAALVSVANFISKDSATGSAAMPAGTTAQRSVTSLVAGWFRFNTDLSKFEGYNGTSWGSVGGGATGGGSDTIFNQNGQTVTTSYTLPTGQNASSVGKITVITGAVVTLSTGSRWVIL